MPIYADVIDGRGRAANLYYLCAVAEAHLARHGHQKLDRQHFKNRVLTAPTFDLSVEIIREYFPVKLDD